MAGAWAFSAEADPPNDPSGLALVKRKTIRRRVLAPGFVRRLEKLREGGAAGGRFPQAITAGFALSVP
jgi:hypothetical protein